MSMPYSLRGYAISYNLRGAFQYNDAEFLHLHHLIEQDE
jgi:hypothetical protein